LATVDRDGLVGPARQRPCTRVPAGCKRDKPVPLLRSHDVSHLAVSDPHLGLHYPRHVENRQKGRFTRTASGARLDRRGSLPGGRDRGRGHRQQRHQSKSNGADDFLRAKIGPWDTALLPAKQWVHIEHSAFWLAVICAVLSFVFSK